MINFAVVQERASALFSEIPWLTYTVLTVVSAHAAT